MRVTHPAGSRQRRRSLENCKWKKLREWVILQESSSFEYFKVTHRRINWRVGILKTFPHAVNELNLTKILVDRVVEWNNQFALPTTKNVNEMCIPMRIVVMIGEGEMPSQMLRKSSSLMAQTIPPPRPLDTAYWACNTQLRFKNCNCASH